MRPWRFRAYCTEAGRCSYRDWYDDLIDEAVRAAVDDVMTRLRLIEDWATKRKEFKPLTREHAPLSELRFHADRISPRGKLIETRRYRVVGLLRPDEEEPEFILFAGARKFRDGVIDPPGAFDRALLDLQMMRDGRGVLIDIL